MASRKVSTYVDIVNDTYWNVWTNNNNAIALAAITGVEQVDWLNKSKYGVTIDPRFDAKELLKEILALQ